ncbi:MAG: inorganic diphosphatase [Candidatus Binatia bacterium]
MPAGFDQLPARDPETELLNVVVDTPKGSRNKYKWDDERGLWRLRKVLPLGASFPFDFGFVPSTRGGDGDPLDVLILMDEATFPGCVVSARLIGVLEARQTEKRKSMRNDRLVAVVETELNPPEVLSLSELDRHRLDGIEHFFVSYNEMEGRRFEPLGRKGPTVAHRLVRRATIR